MRLKWNELMQSTGLVVPCEWRKWIYMDPGLLFCLMEISRAHGNKSILEYLSNQYLLRTG